MKKETFTDNAEVAFAVALTWIVVWILVSIWNAVIHLIFK